MTFTQICMYWILEDVPACQVDHLMISLVIRHVHRAQTVAKHGRWQLASSFAYSFSRHVKVCSVGTPPPLELLSHISGMVLVFALPPLNKSAWAQRQQDASSV